MKPYFIPYQHYSSPINFAPEVVAELEIPEKITIYDSTVRKLLLTPGMRASVGELADIAKLSYDAGLHTTVLNVHWWGSSEPEPYAHAVARRISNDSSARITISTDVFNSDRWVEALPVFADLGPAAVSMDIPLPDIEGQKDIDLNRQLDRLAGGCEILLREGIEPMLGVLDIGRAHPEAMARYIDVGISAGCTSMLLHDSTSSLSPEGMKHAVRGIRRRAPGIPVVMHVHNDVGMAEAGCIAAVTAGAHPDVSACGVSYRAGFAKLEAVAATLISLYGVDLDLDWERIQELCRRVDVLVPPGGFRGLSGTRAFLKESTAAYPRFGGLGDRPLSDPDAVLSAEGFGGENHFVWGRNLIAEDSALEAKLKMLGMGHGADELFRAREKLLNWLIAVSDYPYWLEDSQVDDILLAN